MWTDTVPLLSPGPFLMLLFLDTALLRLVSRPPLGLCEADLLLVPVSPDPPISRTVT